jgi:hypothetical protein
MTLKLSMMCCPHDRARAIIDRVKPEGITLDITVNDNDVDRQRRSVRGEFGTPHKNEPEDLFRPLMLEA